MAVTRNRAFAPAVPFFFAYSTSSQTISTSGTWLTWNTVPYQTKNFHYKTGTDRIYLRKNSYGFYRIKVELSVYEVSAADHTRIQLYKNGTALDGSKAEGKSNDADDAVSISLEYITTLKQMDYIQVKAMADGGSTKTLAHSCRIIIEFIPTYGWNNGSGGRPEFKGVLR